MNFTYNWQPQPQVAQKGPSSNSIVPTMSRPFNNGPFNAYSGTFDNGGKFWGKARSLKQWRKRLVPQLDSGGGTSGVGIPMDTPGGSVYLGSAPSCSVDCSGSYALKENMAKNPILMVKKKNFDSKGVTEPSLNLYDVCFACNPERNIIKSGMTNLNKYNMTYCEDNNQQYVQKQRYYADSNAYLRSRNKKYVQNLATGYKVPEVAYYNEDGQLLPPKTNAMGSQTYNYAKCGNCTCENKKHLVYKPSNPNFSKEYAVDSGTRLLRLKVNTVNKSAKNLKGWGQGAQNASVYNGTYNSPYILKSKYQRCVNRRLPGNHTICFYTPPESSNPIKVPKSIVY